MDKKSKALMESIHEAMKDLAEPWFMASPAEASKLIEAEFAEQSEAVAKVGKKIATRLTASGLAAYLELLNENEVGALVPPLVNINKNLDLKMSDTAFEIESGIPLPANKRRGNRAIYPFEALRIGDSFHVSPTEKQPDPVKTVASSVSSANLRYSEPTDQMETFEINDFQVDADGKRIKNAEGGYIKIGVKNVTRPVMRQLRLFTVRQVGDEDRKGPGARVYRVG